MSRTDTRASYSRQLADRILAIGTDDIPASAYDAAGRLLLDAVACAVAGRSAPGVQIAAGQMRDWGGKPEASLLFSGERVPGPNAAFANAAMIHALDLDDVYTPATLHLSSVMVPAMLAAGETVDATGREALAAMILGLETASRIGLAEQARRRGGGFLPTSLAGSFGAVLTAARLLGLSKEQIVSALGINYAQMAGNRQALLDHSLTKRLQPGFAARSALWAVALACSGITGPHRVFEGEAGYFRLYLNGDVPEPEELLQAGHAFAVEHVSTKRYPSCGACHPVQDAAERLREEENLVADAIERVELFGVPSLVSRPFRVGDNPQVNAQFCAAWGVAHTLLRGPARLADYAQEAIRADREVCQLAACIQHVAVPEDLPPPPALPRALRRTASAYRTAFQGVIVHTRDGRCLRRFRAPCQTFAPSPADWDDLRKKLANCVDAAEAQALNIDDVVQCIGSLERLPLHRLLRCLRIER